MVPATDVDHIVPHRGDQALFWDPTADAADFVVLDDDGLTGVPQPAGVYIGGAGAGDLGPFDRWHHR